MDISIIKKQRQNAWSILKISSVVWARMFKPCVKVIGLGILFTAAFATLWIVFAPQLHREYVLWAMAVMPGILLLSYIILGLALPRAAYDIFDTQKPSVIDGIDKAIRALPKIFAAVFLLGGVFYILSLINIRIGLIAPIVYVPVFAVLGAFLFLCFGFYTMTILFRDSAVGAAFRFTFSTFKKKWAPVFLKTLLGLIAAFAFWAIYMSALSGGIYLVFEDTLRNVYGYWGNLGFFIFFYYGARLWLPLALFAVLSAFGAVLAWGFLSAYMTTLFLNAELSEEPAPAADKEEVIPAAGGESKQRQQEPEQLHDLGEPHDFTEFFQSSKPVDVTERVSENETLPPLARATREEALRGFGHEDEDIPSFEGISEVKRGEDDIFEILSDLKEDTKPPLKDKNLPSSILSDRTNKKDK